MGDPELVARAQRAAMRLERSWDRWRRLNGLAAEPAQPVSSYVGYSLTEPWGRPRVVFGVGAEEAEQLSALLEQDVASDPRFSQGLLWEPETADRPAESRQHTANGAQQPEPAVPQQPTQNEHLAVPAPAGPAAQRAQDAARFQQAPAGDTAGPADRGMLQGTGADLAGWTSGELPGQASASLAAWPPAGTAQEDGAQRAAAHQGPAGPSRREPAARAAEGAPGAPDPAAWLRLA